MVARRLNQARYSAARPARPILVIQNNQDVLSVTYYEDVFDERN